MSGPMVAVAALAEFVEIETQRWREWFAATPEALEVETGPGGEGTIRVLVKHIFAVELRYAQRLAGEPISPYDDLDDSSVDALWAIHNRATELRDRWLSTATAEELHRTLTFETRRMGTLSATAHAILVHSIMHGVRHWAQAATVLRQHGHGGLWDHDWLFSPAARVD